MRISGLKKTYAASLPEQNSLNHQTRQRELLLVLSRWTLSQRGNIITVAHVGLLWQVCLATQQAINLLPSCRRTFCVDVFQRDSGTPVVTDAMF